MCVCGKSLCRLDAGIYQIKRRLERRERCASCRLLIRWAGWLQRWAQFVGGSQLERAGKMRGKSFRQLRFGWAGLTSCQILRTPLRAKKKWMTEMFCRKREQHFCYIISLFQFALVICFLLFSFHLF